MNEDLLIYAVQEGLGCIDCAWCDGGVWGSPDISCTHKENRQENDNCMLVKADFLCKRFEDADG